MYRGADLVEHVRAIATEGVHHIVEVAFGTNISIDLKLLSIHGSVATYATDAAIPTIPLGFRDRGAAAAGSDRHRPRATRNGNDPGPRCDPRLIRRCEIDVDRARLEIDSARTC